MRKVSLVVSLLAGGLACGCSGGGGSAPAPAISVNVSSNPSTTKGVQFSAQVQFTATVINDPQNRGVTWTISGASCAGASNPCGTVSPTNTPSGQPTTYTAPSNAPATNSVTVTATSVSDPTRFDQVTFTIGVISAAITSPNPLPTSVAAQTQVQFTPTVSDDPQNRGVAWTITGASCSGAGNPCGTVSPNSTPSGHPQLTPRRTARRPPTR